LFYFVLIGIGFGVDFIIMESLNIFDAEFYIPHMFGTLSVCYLLATEALSILENLGEMGIEVPYLSKGVEKMRNKISEKGGDNG